MITYDELYSLFLSNSMLDKIFLPSSEQQIYDLIGSAIKRFNSKMDKQLKHSHIKEIIEEDLDDTDQLILMKFMKIQCLNNALTYKNSIFTTFTKEIGVRNINGQINSLKDQIQMEQDELDAIIFNGYDDVSIM